MDSDTTEIRDDEINVVEIMDRIRENIRRRQAAAEMPLDPDSIIGSASKSSTAGESNDAVQRDLLFINSNWEMYNNSYVISSHHPNIGKFLVRTPTGSRRSSQVCRSDDLATDRIQCKHVRIINHSL
jgi:O-antigen chain-terminating methyltransferase